MSKNKIDWPVTLFLALNPIISFILLFVYLYSEKLNWNILIFALFFAAATTAVMLPPVLAVSLCGCVQFFLSDSFRWPTWGGRFC
jgi:hypothetical protein